MGKVKKSIHAKIKAHIKKTCTISPSIQLKAKIYKNKESSNV